MDKASSTGEGKAATVTRMAPDEVYDTDIDAHQGWAMSEHAPTGGTGQAVDLLFVHGMAAGGWMWSADWLAAFTDQGYRCWTLTLPGRAGGQTLATNPQALDRALAIAFHKNDPEAALAALAKAIPGASTLDGPGISEFTDALALALKRIGRPTVPVCHSLGGAVAQNLMRRGQSPAGTVLLCSTPPYGFWRSSVEMAFTNPDLWRALFDFSLFGQRGTDMDVMRRNLFPRGVSNGDYSEMVGNLRDESFKALAQANGFPPFAPLPGPRGDVLVIGGTEDRFVPWLDIMFTGTYYGTLPVIVQGGGHMLVSEPVWPRAADAILDWLPGLTNQRAAA